jgi:hypothetical protein
MRSVRPSIYGERVTTARRFLAAALASVLALLVAAPAGADAPARLATPVTDDAGALGNGRASVDSALATLQSDAHLQLWVVFVESFDATPAQAWTDETARLSDLGAGDALLAVATTDRAYAYSFPDDPRFSDAELADVAQQDIEPALSRGDWPGAVVAAANGYRDAAGGSSFSAAWVPVLLIVVIAGVLIWVVRRRRKRRPAAPTGSPAGPPPVATEEQSNQANALLIELDDDLRASESELSLAAAQYGTAATAQFRTALEAARQDVAEAFRLRMTLDDVPAPDEQTRRQVLTEIIAKCRTADERLDAESEAFDRLRDLEGRAAEVAGETERRRAAVEAALPAAAGSLQELTQRYAGTAVTALTANVDQAAERLRFAAEALTRARAALAGTTRATPAGAGASGTGIPAGPGSSEDPARAVPGGDRAEAALAVRAAEQAVDQAEQLVGAVRRAGPDLAAARAGADALIAEVTAEIAAGRSGLNGGGPAPAGLAAAVTGAEQTLTEVRAAFAAPKTDPVAAVARLQAADAELDRALAEARDAAERGARARSQLAQVLPVARAQVAAVGDFITTRRGAVDAGPRAALSEAQRHLALAESLATTDPVTALQEAQQAHQLASNAGQAAHADVQSWGGYGGGGGHGGNFDAGAFAGAVLGGILAGGGRSGGYGGGFGGGWGGGGFGGSGSRGRRTGGGGGGGGGRRGGGGGRRGGGGRF